MNLPSDTCQSVLKLLEVMRKLRSPHNGCPWDKEQTHSSLKKYLMEECAELMDSIDDEDKEGMLEELGDILLQIVFHSQIAEEKGDFCFKKVVDNLNAKLIRRHPHVFGGQIAETAEKVVELWEEIKKKEKNKEEKSFESHMDGISRHFPALFHAQKIQEKAANVGFDWRDSSQIVEKIEEELAELKEAMKGENKEKVDEEIGDLLFSIVNLARFLKGVNAEELLAKTIQKFQKRFRYIEENLSCKGQSPENTPLEEMDRLWNEAKKAN